MLSRLVKCYWPYDRFYAACQHLTLREIEYMVYIRKTNYPLLHYIIRIINIQPMPGFADGTIDGSYESQSHLWREVMRANHICDGKNESQSHLWREKWEPITDLWPEVMKASHICDWKNESWTYLWTEKMKTQYNLQPDPIRTISIMYDVC